MSPPHGTASAPCATDRPTPRAGAFEAARHIRIIHHPQARYRARMHIVHLHYRNAVKRILKLSGTLALRWGLPRRIELTPLDPAELACELRRRSQDELLRISSEHAALSRKARARRKDRSPRNAHAEFVGVVPTVIPQNRPDGSASTVPATRKAHRITKL